MRLPSLIVVFACLFAFSEVAAGPFDEGKAAYDGGDFARALQLWKPLADSGDAASQYNIGRMYTGGRGVQKDLVEAAKWYQLAARQGYAEARSMLGTLYSYGIGVTKDQAEAVKWTQLAAQQGNPDAQDQLILWYTIGNGVPKDPAAAARWNRIAAEQGRTSAQEALALRYIVGDGVPKDYVLAYLWYNQSAIKGSKAGVDGRKVAAELMSQAQVQRALRMVRDWKPTSSQTTAGDTGSAWESHTVTDHLEGKTGQGVKLIGTISDSSGSDDAALVVNCAKNSTTIYVESDNAFFGLSPLAVRYATDNGPVQRGWWSTCKGGHCAGLWNGAGIPFLRDLFGKSTLRLIFERRFAENLNAEFVVSGAKRSIGPVGQLCGWLSKDTAVVPSR